MNSINLRVGTRIDYVEKLAKKANISEDVKSLIFSFCKNDLDRIVSDDIERHILKTWLSGERKIKMPKVKDGSIIRESYNHCDRSFHNSSWTTEDGQNAVSICSFVNQKMTSETTLWDENKDGYADFYTSSHHLAQKSNSVYNIDVSSNGKWYKYEY